MQGKVKCMDLVILFFTYVDPLKTFIWQGYPFLSKILKRGGWGRGEVGVGGVGRSGSRALGALRGARRPDRPPPQPPRAPSPGLHIFRKKKRIALGVSIESVFLLRER